MSLSWGAWETSGGNGMRVGVDAYWSTVTTSSTTATLTMRVYTENQYRYDDNQVLTYSGSSGMAGSTSYNNTSSGGAVLRATRTYTWTYAAGSYGTSPGSVTFAATVSGAYNGVTPSRSLTYTIPARPGGVPVAPSAVVATRNSDAQATLTWTRNPTTQKPYTSQTVARAIYSGTSWGAWAVVATLGGTATSYVSTGLSANRAYRYEIRANNTAGSSAYVVSNDVFMTPSAPTAATAGVNSAGSQIVVRWTNNHYTSALTTLRVERSINGAAWAEVVTGLASATTTWTDTSPGGGSNAYRVRAYMSTGALFSGYATSNTVTTSTPPLAPTVLTPNGTAQDLNADLLLTWQHNHGGDGAAQSAFTIEFSSNGGGTWGNTVVVSSAIAAYTLPAATLANGTTYLWRVKTRGSTIAAYGVNSASATIIGSARPTATLSEPTATTVALPLGATWAYGQDQGSAQSQWEAILYAADGVTVLESRLGYDTASTLDFAEAVEDGVSYVVKVRVRSAAGLWSLVASQDTVIDLPPPAQTGIEAEYDPCVGAMVLHLTALAPIAGEVDVLYATVERRVPGGEWLALVVNVPLPTDVVDPSPLTHGDNEYRVTGLSGAPSYRIEPVVVAPGTDGRGSGHLWAFLSYGPGFTNVLRVRGDLSVSEEASTTSAVKPFLGRRLPVLLLGANDSHSVSVKGVLRFDAACVTPELDDCRFDSPPADWIRAAHESAGVVLYRDYTGRRIFGQLGGVSLEDGPIVGMASVSFTVTEVSYVETYGITAEVV